jgi:hypothetical protein
MSHTDTEISHTEDTEIPRYTFTEIHPAITQARSSSLKTIATETPSSKLFIGGDRRHFVNTVLKNGENDFSTALAHTFQTVVSQAIASGGTSEVVGLYQKDLFYGRKSAAVAIASMDNTGRDDSMRITETADGEVLSGDSLIPGNFKRPDLVLVIIPRPWGASKPARLVLLESGTLGVSFRSREVKTNGIPDGHMMIADTVTLSPTMILGNTSDGTDFTDRILFGWGAFGSAAMLTLLAAQAIRLVSWSYREYPGDWISSHNGEYTFGDVILDQEASRAYLTQTAESADAFSESAHLYGYKALRYIYRTTSRIVERAMTLLETANPHLARYLEDKRMEFINSIGWQADAVPSFIRSYLPVPADRLLDSMKHVPAA